MWTLFLYFRFRLFVCNYFVTFEFNTGLYYDEYTKKGEEIRQLRIKMMQMKDEIVALESSWMKTSGHGSKDYGYDVKIKAAARVTGHKEGEWCNEFDMPYGKTHSKYGGTLTDLRTLPVGTSFTVTNGAYDGKIIADEHGDKAIATYVNVIKLTEDHNAAFIGNVRKQNIFD